MIFYRIFGSNKLFDFQTPIDMHTKLDKGGGFIAINSSEWKSFIKSKIISKAKKKWERGVWEMSIQHPNDLSSLQDEKFLFHISIRFENLIQFLVVAFKGHFECFEYMCWQDINVPLTSIHKIERIGRCVNMFLFYLCTNIIEMEILWGKGTRSEKRLFCTVWWRGLMIFIFDNYQFLWSFFCNIYSDYSIPPFFRKFTSEKKLFTLSAK